MTVDLAARCDWSRVVLAGPGDAWLDVAIAVMEELDTVVVRARDEEELALRCREVRLDLGIVGLASELPGGWEWSSKIRDETRRAWGSAPPCVGVSDLLHRSLRNRCLAAGFSDYLQAPVSASRLLRMT